MINFAPLTNDKLRIKNFVMIALSYKYKQCFKLKLLMQAVQTGWLP